MCPEWHSHFSGTTTVRVSRKAAPKEMSLEATAEDRQRFCSRDVLWQIVPDTRGSNRKSPVADGWQPSLAHNQRWWRRGAKTATSFDVSRQSSSARYGGADHAPCISFGLNLFIGSRAVEFTRFLQPSPTDLDLWTGDLFNVIGVMWT